MAEDFSATIFLCHELLWTLETPFDDILLWMTIATDESFKKMKRNIAREREEERVVWSVSALSLSPKSVFLTQVIVNRHSQCVCIKSHSMVCRVQLPHST